MFKPTTTLYRILVIVFKNIFSCFWVAKCFIATGDIASARQALETALSLEPNNSAVTQENNALKTLQKHQTDATNAFNAGDHRKVSHVNYIGFILVPNFQIC